MEKKCQTIIDRFRLKDTKERDPRLSEVLKNGNRIIACWRNKQIHGDAEIYYNNGSYFKYFSRYLEVYTRTVSKREGTSSFLVVLSILAIVLVIVLKVRVFLSILMGK